MFASGQFLALEKFLFWRTSYLEKSKILTGSWTIAWQCFCLTTGPGYLDILRSADSFSPDCREVPVSQVHWEPDTRQVDIPADVVGHILSDGEFVVWHIDDRKVLTKIREQDVQIIGDVRDPRSILLTLFHFAQKKQHPTPRGMLWRSMPEEQRFKALVLSKNVKSFVDLSRVQRSISPFSVLKISSLVKRSRRAAGCQISKSVEVISEKSGHSGAIG